MVSNGTSQQIRGNVGDAERDMSHTHVHSKVASATNVSGQATLKAIVMPWKNSSKHKESSTTWRMALLRKRVWENSATWSWLMLAKSTDSTGPHRVMQGYFSTTSQWAWSRTGNPGRFYPWSLLRKSVNWTRSNGIENMCQRHGSNYTPILWFSKETPVIYTEDIQEIQGRDLRPSRGDSPT